MIHILMEALKVKLDLYILRKVVGINMIKMAILPTSR